MIYKTDKIEFRVTYIKNNEFKTEIFTSFAAAAGCASALNNITRYIDLKVVGNDSSVSCSLYKYSKESNNRELISNYWVNELIKNNIL